MQENIIVFPEPPPGDKAQLVMPTLPVSLTPLVGREREIQAIQVLLSSPEVRLLTLTGTAGVGKTRLALEVARRLVPDFADGVYMVSLAPISDPDLVIPTIAHRLGLMEAGTQPVLDLLKLAQRDKQRLLVLDNFEQIIAASPLLIELLEACPDLKLLVTSREVLRLRGEHQFTVPPLALPDPKHLPDAELLANVAAVHLFLQRAQVITSDFQLTTDNAATIAQICRRLDGLPLAIELAAARSKLLAPQALLARLDHRLHVLTGGARDLPLRQRTLRNTLAWSYELLTAQEQRLFRRLSIFVGGCTLEAIEAVCAALDDGANYALEGVASLIDKSLLHQTEQGKAELRLSMLETVREYGLECLAANGEGDVTRQAQALYYVALAEKAEPELAGPQQAEWLERLEWEYDNLRAVLWWLLEQGEINHQSKREMALRLAGALWRFWEVRGHWGEGWNFLGRALARSERMEGPMQVKALRAAARLAYLWGDTDRAEGLCEECLGRCRGLGDTGGMAFSLRLLGLIAERRDHLPAAHAHYEEAVVLFRRGDDKEGLAWSLFNLAYLLSLQGEYVRGSPLLEQALTLLRELGNKQGIAWVLIRLADVLFMSQGSGGRVHALLEEGLTLSRELGYKLGIAQALCLLGEVTLMEGDVAKASSLAQQSLALSRELGNEWHSAETLLLGRVTAVQGDYPAARAWYEESLTVCLKVGNRHLIAPGLEGLAGVVAAQGQPTWAARLWGAAEALREATALPLPLIDRAGYEQVVAATRAQLGARAFAAAWAEGRRMTPEQALAELQQAPLSELVPAAKHVPPPTASTDLTSREMEVLRLLVQGLTSAQIAEQLVIGLVTVNSHVRSIYSKLGVTSRAAATRYALEHKLL